MYRVQMDSTTKQRYIYLDVLIAAKGREDRPLVYLQYYFDSLLLIRYRMLIRGLFEQLQVRSRVGTSVSDVMPVAKSMWVSQGPVK